VKFLLQLLEMFKRIFLAIVFLLFASLPARVFAADEFATSYDVLYDVSETGITTVTEKITLKNLTSEYYANQFKLTIGATQISDVKASDPGGPLEVSQEQKDSATTINIKHAKAMRLSSNEIMLDWDKRTVSDELIKTYGSTVLRLMSIEPRSSGSTPTA